MHLMEMNFIQLNGREKELDKVLTFLEGEKKKVDIHQENINNINFLIDLVKVEKKEIQLLKSKPIKMLRRME